MLRGLTDVSFWADDVDAAMRWYAELLASSRTSCARRTGRRRTWSSGWATTRTSWA
jgi:hypothetical protein